MEENSSIKIIYTSDISEEEKSLIQDYWSYEYPFYMSEKVGDLLLKYNVSKRDITDLIRSSCFVELFCSKCKSYMGKYGNRSELDVTRFYERGSICCDDCWLEIKQPIVQEVIKVVEKPYQIESKIVDRLNLGLGLKKWLELNVEELEVLIKVTESIGKIDILNSVLIDDNWKSDYNKKYWAILNKLHKLNLIFIERESEQNKKIKEIHFHSQLSQNLRNEFPDLYLKKEKLRAEFVSIDLKAKPVFRKKNDAQPDYSGVVKIHHDRLIGKNDFVQASLWKVEDEISIRINRLAEGEVEKFILIYKEEEE